MNAEKLSKPSDVYRIAFDLLRDASAEAVAFHRDLDTKAQFSSATVGLLLAAVASFLRISHPNKITMMIVVLLFVALLAALILAIAALLVRRGSALDRVSLAIAVFDLCAQDRVEDHVRHGRTAATTVGAVLAEIEEGNARKADFLRWSQILTIVGAILAAIALIAIANGPA